MNTKYYNILNSISENLSEEDARYVKDNIAKINHKLLDLSDYIRNYVNISADQNYSEKEKIENIKNLGFKNETYSYSQAKEILDVLNLNLKGGNQSEENINQVKSALQGKDLEVCLKNIPLLILELMSPAYIFKTMFAIFSQVSKNVMSWFSKGIDWVYFFLFLSSSVPFYGAISDFIIVVKALVQGDYFLASITTLTSTISTMMNFHLTDMGVLFKIFYYLDSKSRDKSDKGNNMQMNLLSNMTSISKKVSENMDPSTHLSKLAETSKNLSQLSDPKIQLEKLADASSLIKNNSLSTGGLTEIIDKINNIEKKINQLSVNNNINKNLDTKTKDINTVDNSNILKTDDNQNQLKNVSEKKDTEITEKKDKNKEESLQKNHDKNQYLSDDISNNSISKYELMRNIDSLKKRLNNIETRYLNQNLSNNLSLPVNLTSQNNDMMSNISSMKSKLIPSMSNPLNNITKQNYNRQLDTAKNVSNKFNSLMRNTGSNLLKKSMNSLPTKGQINNFKLLNRSPSTQTPISTALPDTKIPLNQTNNSNATLDGPPFTQGPPSIPPQNTQIPLNQTNNSNATLDGPPFTQGPPSNPPKNTKIPLNQTNNSNATLDGPPFTQGPPSNPPQNTQIPLNQTNNSNATLDGPPFTQGPPETPPKNTVVPTNPTLSNKIGGDLTEHDYRKRVLEYSISNRNKVSKIIGKKIWDQSSWKNRLTYLDLL